MDPTIKLCKIENSFGVKYKPEEPNLYHVESKKLVYQDTKKENKITIIPPRKDLESFVTNIGQSIFDHWSTIIWANIDGVFNVSEYNGGYIKQQTDRYYAYFDYTNCDDRWNNGRADYILYRYVGAYGYTISSNEYYENADNLICVGSDYNDLDKMIQLVNVREPYGVYLFMSDRISNISHLVKAGYLIGKILRKDKHAVLRLPIEWSNELENIIYILSKFFGQVGIIRPITSDQNQSYLVLKNYSGGSEMSSTFNSFMLHGIKNVEIDDKFLIWLEQIKDYLLFPEPELQKSNYSYCLILWNLPDNPEPYYDV